MHVRPARLLCFFLFTFALATPARPDSWGPPSQFERFSDNRQFVAQITPAQTVKTSPTQEKSGPRMDVFELQGETRTKQWSTDLSNSVSPCTAYVADDGAYVVTTDNYFGVGYGDDVVAFYGKSGQLRKYSLEQLFPELEDRLESMNKFAHSTSSRWWNTDSVQFFDSSEKPLIFCIWVNWANTWLAWNAETGERMDPSKQQIARWNQRARKQALELISQGNPESAALKSLGRLKHPEDRAAIEQQLKDTQFYTGSVSSSSTEGSTFAYRSYSEKRLEADRILAEWDELQKGDEYRGDTGRYHFLGEVKMVITFPQAPLKGEGLIGVYLIPEKVKAGHWDSAKPDHYLVVDLSHNFPTDFDSGQIRDGKLEQAVNFEIEGVTPGNYWI